MKGGTIVFGRVVECRLALDVGHLFDGVQERAELAIRTLALGIPIAAVDGPVFLLAVL